MVHKLTRFERFTSSSLRLCRRFLTYFDARSAGIAAAAFERVGHFFMYLYIGAVFEQHPWKGGEPSRLYRRRLLAGRFFERPFQARFQKCHHAVAVHSLAQRLWRYLHVWIAFFKGVAQTLVTDGRLIQCLDRQQVEKSIAS